MVVVALGLETLTWEQLVEEGRKAVKELSAWQWKVGELGNAVARKYKGNAYKLREYADAIGISLKRLRKYMNVAEVFDPKHRQHKLSMQHYETVVAIARTDFEKARALLDYAELSGLSYHSFRKLVKALKYEPNWKEKLQALVRGDIEVEDVSRGTNGTKKRESDEERLEELYAEVERLDVLCRARLLSYLATALWAKHVNELDEGARIEAYSCMDTAVEHLRKQMRRVTGIDKKAAAGAVREVK